MLCIRSKLHQGLGQSLPACLLTAFVRIWKKYAPILESMCSKASIHPLLWVMAWEAGLLRPCGAFMCACVSCLKA